MVCKTTHGLLRLLNKGGTAFPGRAALKLCPGVLEKVSRGINIIAVTGTNGKTTACRMIEAALARAGLPVMANRSGANLQGGITTQFILNTDAGLHPKKCWAVIECDEAASVRVFGQMHPRVVVVTNIFRDQLDRYGEVTHTRELIVKALRSCPDAVLCLNADCSLTASIAGALPNRTRFFGLAEPAAAGRGDPGESDAPRCIFCGGAYAYDYRSYAHLGGFFCPKCGWSRPRADVEVTRIVEGAAESSTVLMRVDGRMHRVRIGLGAIYNVYNAAAAAAAVTAAGLDAAPALAALSDFRRGFGRMESFPLGTHGAQMLLVKNPAALDRALEHVLSSDGEFALALCLNDRAADGRDVSWIWDAGLERLASASGLRQVFVSGDRAYDMALRLKYSGLAAERIVIQRDHGELIKMLGSCGCRVYILPTYTAMLELRSLLVRRVGGSQFWELT